MTTVPPGMVDIHYHRPPDRKDVYRQFLLYDGDDVKVSFARDLDLGGTLHVGRDLALEKGSDVVWFTFPDAWHDIGLFHRADGTFSGVYANIITPCAFEAPDRWRTTDLFLDVWIGPDGSAQILDEDEFRAAEEAGWLAPEVAERAWAEARALNERAEAGAWPPPVVVGWDRDRALAAL